jgi:cytochrome c oxidase subunit 1
VPADWLSTTDHKVIGHLYLFASFGFFLIAGLMALILLASFLYNVYKTWKTGEQVTADDSWGYANSLEWVTFCPPPRHNFTRIPRIRSERPAFDLHYPTSDRGGPGHA